MGGQVGNGTSRTPLLLALSLILVAVIGYSPFDDRNTRSLTAASPPSAETSPNPSPPAGEVSLKAITVLRSHCWNCHGSAKQQGGLRLDSQAALLVGGRSGPAVVPHDPAKSILIEAVRYDQDRQMPPKGQLSKEDVDILGQWVTAGAAWPSAAAMDRASDKTAFWSFQPVKEPIVPTIEDTSWPNNEVDRFVLAKLEKQKLSPAARADKLTLLRRVTFDLIGLPPTRGEIEAFLKDESPEAYALVVDRLLASLHYGEQWGRHWLDLVCFAETDNDKPKLNAHRYRDYVIDAFNEDLPYNRFVAEHFAGDLLPNPRRNARGTQVVSPVATGFLWLRELPQNRLVTEKEADRADYVADQIDVIGKAFLGLTVACARCHDHKFDPISQEDYYALAGILYSSQMASEAIQSPQSAAEKAELRQQIETLCRQIAATRLQSNGVGAAEGLGHYLLAANDLLARTAKPSRYEIRTLAVRENLDVDLLANWTAYLGRPGLIRDPVFGPWARFSRIPAGVFRKQFARLLDELKRDQARKSEGKMKSVLAPVIARFYEVPEPTSLEEVAASYQKVVQEALRYFADGRANDAQAELVNHLLEKSSPLASRLLGPESNPAVDRLRAELAELQERETALALSTSEGKPENVHVNIAGSTKNLGREVPRGFLKLLSGSTPSLTGSGRDYLAKIIADEHNPLTARVLVNRCWQHHFGQGLVRTSSDFGSMGEAPSHPELLDYLTRRFIESGWSIKALHRLMVLSSTYQTATTPSDEALAMDPENKLLQHMPVRRLEAECVRDSILAVTGGLNPEAGGPSILPPAIGGPVDGKGRRSIYLQVNRVHLTPLLVAFDFPRPNSSVGRRYSTTLPAQTLVLLNDEFVHQQAERWGKQIAKESGEPGQRVNEMFRAALGRPATETECKAALGFIERQAAQYQQLPGSMTWKSWADLAQCLFNLDQFLLLQ